jgi:hypothetical protein
MMPSRTHKASPSPALTNDETQGFHLDLPHQYAMPPLEHQSDQADSNQALLSQALER